MDALISLYYNVAEYFEEGHKKWREAVDGGDPVAMAPRWIETYQGNLEAAEYWRKKAAELDKADELC